MFSRLCPKCKNLGLFSFWGILADMPQITDIAENQPHIVVTLPDSVNVICLSDLRFRMNDKAEPLLMRCLCKAVLDKYDSNSKNEDEA